MAKTKTKKPSTTRRKSAQQEEIEGTRTVHSRIEKLAKAYSVALDDLTEARKDVDQKKRLALAAMQAEGVELYRIGEHQLRLDRKINVRRERAPKPKKRDTSGKLLAVESIA